MPWKVSADPADREQVEAWFRSRVPVTQEEYERLTEDERERSFTIGGTAQLRVVQTVLDEIRRFASTGQVDFAAFQQRLRERLKSGYVDKNAPRLRAALNTTAQMAYGRGRHAQLMEQGPRVAPYLIFDAVLDARTSDLCRRLNGTVLRADHPWWRTHWPPCHINCRSSVRALSARTARRKGVARRPPQAQPDAGFGLSPDEQPVWEPDATDFDAQAFERFKAKLATMRAARKVARRATKRGPS